ncbi:hypothetical protein LWI28_013490 [Acer negundo]|uniref:Uncharacterized protein n=1 Tax=Acer negundo TaxID=4023 RepID=A0AAD5JD11_ACENE|nr:hypothetical protein LWI28_013490 [Acer negundo]
MMVETLPPPKKLKRRSRPPPYLFREEAMTPHTSLLPVIRTKFISGKGRAATIIVDVCSSFSATLKTKHQGAAVKMSLLVQPRQLSD